MDTLQKYNKKNTRIVVSSYPDKKDGIRNLNAIAWYAQKTFKGLANKGRKLIILAEIIKEPEVFEDGNLLVIRCWRRNSPFYFFDLIRWIRFFNYPSNIIVEFEFNMLGGIFCTLSFPLFLIALRALRKKITLELHQVVLDINDLSGHLGLQKKGLFASVFNFSLKYFMK